MNKFNLLDYSNVLFIRSWVKIYPWSGDTRFGWPNSNGTSQLFGTIFVHHVGYPYYKWGATLNMILSMTYCLKLHVHVSFCYWCTFLPSKNVNVLYIVSKQPVWPWLVKDAMYNRQSEHCVIPNNKIHTTYHIYCSAKPKTIRLCSPPITLLEQSGS